MQALSSPAGAFTAPDQRPPWAHSYDQANIAAWVRLRTPATTTTVTTVAAETTSTTATTETTATSRGRYRRRRSRNFSSSRYTATNYVQHPPPPPPQTPAYYGNYAQPQAPPPPQQQPPVCYWSYAQQQPLPPAQQHHPSIYGYNPQQQPLQPPQPLQQQHPSGHTPPSSLLPSPGPSPPPQPGLHLQMARSAPQCETELESILDEVGLAGLTLTSQTHGRVSGRGTEGATGSEYWVSDNGATSHIISDARNVYDWVDIPPERRKVMIGDGKVMRVIGVGSLNLRMHSKADFDVKLTGVYVTEGIGFNVLSLHQAQARQTIILAKKTHTCSINNSFSLVKRSDHACMPLVWTRPRLPDLLLCLLYLMFNPPSRRVSTPLTPWMPIFSCR